MKTSKQLLTDIIDREIYCSHSALITDLRSGRLGTDYDIENDILNEYYEDDEEAQEAGYDDLVTAQREEEDCKEVYEWWQVSKYLFGCLKNINAVVIDSNYGYFWGREETGQSLTMDATLNAVAKRIEAA